MELFPGFLVECCRVSLLKSTSEILEELFPLIPIKLTEERIDNSHNFTS